MRASGRQLYAAGVRPLLTAGILLQLHPTSWQPDTCECPHVLRMPTKIADAALLLLANSNTLALIMPRRLACGL